VPELGQDQLVTRRRLGALDLGQPVLLVGGRPPARVLARRPDRKIDPARALDLFEIDACH